MTALVEDEGEVVLVHFPSGLRLVLFLKAGLSAVGGYTRATEVGIGAKD